MIRKNSVLKTISLLLVGAFCLSDVSYCAPLQGGLGVVGSQKPLEQLAKDPTRFEAPLDFCTLKEIHKGTNDTFIIHIQDAHSNLSGQENLAQTIDSIMAKYRVSLVLVEGSSKEATLDPIKKMAPSEAILKRVAKSFLLQGKIAGEEYLNLVSERPMKIMGIEDRALYLKSIENYGLLADKRKNTLSYLKTIQRALDKLKQKLYPSELLNYENQSQDRGKGFESDFKELLSIAQNKNISLKDFPNIQKLAALQEKEKRIDFNAANLEQAALIEEISQKGGKEDLESQLKKIRQMKNQKVSQFSFFQNTFNIAHDINIQLTLYPNLILYSDYLKEFSDLDLDQVLDELMKTEDKIYTSLLKDRDSRLVRSIDRYVKLLNTAYNIQMSTKEFKLFEINEPDFSTTVYLAFINRKLAELGFFDDLVPYKNLLEDGKRALINFYDSVDKRDMAFVQNTQRILKQENQKVAVLISGGYHTSHLKKLIQERSYSLAVLTPMVTSETNQEKYEKLLLAPIRKEVKKIKNVHGESKLSNKSLSALEKNLRGAKKTDGVKAFEIVMQPENPVLGVPAFAEAFGLQSDNDGARLAIQTFKKRSDNPAYQATENSEPIGPNNDANDLEPINQGARMSARVVDNGWRPLANTVAFMRQILNSDSVNSFLNEIAQRAYEEIGAKFGFTPDEIYRSRKCVEISLAIKNQVDKSHSEYGAQIRSYGGWEILQHDYVVLTALGMGVDATWQQFLEPNERRSDLPKVAIFEISDSGIENFLQSTKLPEARQKFLKRVWATSISGVVSSDKEDADDKYYLGLFDDEIFESEVKRVYGNKTLIPARLDTYIENQSPFKEQALIELIANALDASVGGKSIGRFGVGAYQMFQELIRPEDSVVVTTSTDGKRALRIIFKRIDGELIYKTEMISTGAQQGTRVDVLTNLSREGIEKRKSYVKSKLRANTRGKIYLSENGQRESVNNPQDYHYINGDALNIPIFEPVEVLISENGYSVIDHGSGMSPKILFEKFLVPKGSTKEQKGQPLESPTEIKSETEIFYSLGPSQKRKKGTVSIQVSGVMIQEITIDGVDIPAHMFVELPSDAWLPESGDKIALDETTQNGLLAIMRKLTDVSGSDVKDRYALINALTSLVHRIVEDSEDKSLLNEFRNLVKPLVEEEKKQGKVIMPNRNEFLLVNVNGRGVIYLDESLYDFRPDEIPKAKRIENFRSSKGYKLYVADLDTSQDQTVYLHGRGSFGRGWIILDRKVWKKNKDNPVMINILFNLSIAYEDEGVNLGEVTPALKTPPSSTEKTKVPGPATRPELGRFGKAVRWLRGKLSSKTPTRKIETPKEELQLESRLFDSGTERLLSLFEVKDREFIRSKLAEAIAQGFLNKDNVVSIRSKLQEWLGLLLELQKTLPEGMLADNWVRDEFFQNFILLFQITGKFSLANFKKLNGKLYFTAIDTFGGNNVYEIDGSENIKIIAPHSIFIVWEGAVYLISRDPTTRSDKISIYENGQVKILADNVLLFHLPFKNTDNSVFVIYQKVGSNVVVRTVGNKQLHDFATLDDQVASDLIVGITDPFRNSFAKQAILQGNKIYLVSVFDKEVHQIDASGKISKIHLYKAAGIGFSLALLSNGNVVTIQPPLSLFGVEKAVRIVLYNSSGQEVMNVQSDGKAWVQGDAVYFQSSGGFVRMDKNGQIHHVLDDQQDIFLREKKIANKIKFLSRGLLPFLENFGTAKSEYKRQIVDVQVVGDDVYFVVESDQLVGDITTYRKMEKKISEVFRLDAKRGELTKLGELSPAQRTLIRVGNKIYFFAMGRDTMGQVVSLMEVGLLPSGWLSREVWKGYSPAYQVDTQHIYFVESLSNDHTRKEPDYQTMNVLRLAIPQGNETKIPEKVCTVEGIGLQYQQSAGEGRFDFVSAYDAETYHENEGRSFVDHPNARRFYYSFDLEGGELAVATGYGVDQDSGEIQIPVGTNFLKAKNRQLGASPTIPLLLDRGALFKRNMELMKSYLSAMGHFLWELNQAERTRLLASLLSAWDWSPALIFLDASLAMSELTLYGTPDLLKEAVLKAKNIKEIREIFKFVNFVLSDIDDAKLAARIIERWYRLRLKNIDLAEIVVDKMTQNYDTGQAGLSSTPFSLYAHEIDTAALPSDVQFYLRYLVTDELEAPSVIEDKPFEGQAMEGQIQNRDLASLIWIRYQFPEEVNKPDVTWEAIQRAVGQVEDENLTGTVREYTGAVNGQDKKHYVWLRELTQNARDAIRGVLGIDTQSGFLGHGFYTVFAGGKEGGTQIRIHTGNGTYTYELVLEPVYDPKGYLARIRIVSMKKYRSDYKGTKIQRVIGFNSPADEEAIIGSMYTSYQVKRFLGAVPSQGDGGVSILLNGELVNEDGVKNEDPNRTIKITHGVTAKPNARGKYEWIVGIEDPVGMDLNTIPNKLLPVDVSGKPAQTSPDYDRVRSDLTGHLSSERIPRVTVDGLYVDRVDEKYTALIPDSVLAVLLPRGWNVDFPQGTPVPRTRNGVMNPAQYAPHVAVVALKDLLKLYLTDKTVEIPGLPKDYVYSQTNAIHVRKDIRVDAEKINQGHPEEVDFGKYKNDPHALVQLLTLIKVDYQGKSTALADIKGQVLKEYRKKATEAVNLSSVLPDGMAGLEAFAKRVIDASKLERPVDEKPILQEPIIVAFEKFVEELNKSGEVEANKVDFEIVLNAPHDASAAGKTIKWNLAFYEQNLLPFFEFVVESKTDSDFRRLIEGYVHESSHTLEDEMSEIHGNMWTHIAEQDMEGAFGWIMKRFLMRLMIRLDKISDFRADFLSGIGFSPQQLKDSYDRVVKYVKDAQGARLAEDQSQYIIPLVSDEIKPSPHVSERLREIYGGLNDQELNGITALVENDFRLLGMAVASRSFKETEDYTLEFQQGYAFVSCQKPHDVIFFGINEGGGKGEEIGSITLTDEQVQQGHKDIDRLRGRSLEAVVSAAQKKMPAFAAAAQETQRLLRLSEGGDRVVLSVVAGDLFEMEQRAVVEMLISAKPLLRKAGIFVRFIKPDYTLDERYSPLSDELPADRPGLQMLLASEASVRNMTVPPDSGLLLVNKQQDYIVPILPSLITAADIKRNGKSDKVTQRLRALSENPLADMSEIAIGHLQQIPVDFEEKKDEYLAKVYRPLSIQTLQIDLQQIVAYAQIVARAVEAAA